MKCHKCANALVDGARFCRLCGADQSKGPIAESDSATSPIPQNVSESTKNTCAKCGTEMLTNAAFCRNCGTKVAGAPVASDVSSVVHTPPPNIPHAPPLPDLAASPKTGMPQNEAPIQRQFTHTKRNAAIAMTAIAILGGMGYWGWMNKFKTDAVALKLAEEQQSKKEAEIQQKIKQAEERARKEAEEKAQQALAEKLVTLQSEAQAAQQAEKKARAELEEKLASEKAQKLAAQQAEAKAQMALREKAQKLADQQAAAKAQTALKEKAAADKLKMQRNKASQQATLPEAAPSKPQAQHQSGPRSVKELCADRPNFISQGLCESRSCKNPEWVTSSFCVELNNREKSPSNF